MINALQMKYAKEVLGLDRVIQPPRIRGLYHLHKRNEAPDFLFFGHGVGIPQKELIQKISRALSFSAGWTVDLLSPHSSDWLPLLPSLLVKLRPRAFVVFADEETKNVLQKYSHLPGTQKKGGMWFFSKPLEPAPGEITCSLYAGGGRYIPVPGCILSSLDMFFTSSAHNSLQVSQTKQKAWKRLQRLQKKIAFGKPRHNRVK